MRGAIAAAREAQRLMKVSVVLLSLMVIAVSAYAAYQYFLQFGRWNPVYQMDFTEEGADLSDLGFCGLKMMTDSTRDTCPPMGLLVSTDEERPDMFWLRDVEAAGDVQVRLRVLWPDSVDGLEIHINARREHMTWGWYAPAGFTCQFGGFRGESNFISRNETPQAPNSSGAAKASFEPDTTYELRFQRIGHELSLWVDGHQVLEQIEVLPLAGKGLQKVAIRAWGPTVIKELTVSRLRLSCCAQGRACQHPNRFFTTQKARCTIGNCAYLSLRALRDLRGEP